MLAARRLLPRATRTMQLRSKRAESAATETSAATARSASSSSTRSTGETSEEPVAPPPKKKARAAKPAATVAIAQTAQGASDDRVLHRYPALVPARLLRRYKRFLADVVLAEAGDEDVSTLDETQAITIYCPNTGPMVGLLDEPNARVQLSKSDDPKRKYAYTLEMVRVHNGERHVWVGTHSSSANYMVEKAISSGWFEPQLGAFDVLQREVSFAKNSRVDFVLSRHDGDGDVVHQKYVEVKSVTLAWPPEADDAQRCAVFPDTVSDRAQKHVAELMELIEHRRQANAKKQEAEATSTTKKRVDLSGALVFVVQRDDCSSFMPSLVHDAKFARLCAEAEAAGIQLLPFACRLEPDEHAKTGLVRLLHALPLHEERAKPLDAEDAGEATAKKPSKKPARAKQPSKKYN